MNEVPIDMRLDAARRAASVLYGYGARRVWAFGSLTKPRPPDRRSDVDLAVEGLPPHLQHQATRKASMLVGTRVDVLAMETTPAHLRWAIMRDRVMLLPSDTTPVNQGVAAVGFRPFPSLQQDRLEVAAAVLEDSGARSMIDFGCGPAWLIERLAQTDSFTRLLGIDFAMESLDAGMRRLRRRLPPLQLKKVALLVGLVTDRDPAFLDFDAGVAMEVIEHLAPEPRRAFE